jgi:hypothetical protein
MKPDSMQKRFDRCKDTEGMLLPIDHLWFQESRIAFTRILGQRAGASFIRLSSHATPGRLPSGALSRWEPRPRPGNRGGSGRRRGLAGRAAAATQTARRLWPQAADCRGAPPAPLRSQASAPDWTTTFLATFPQYSLRSKQLYCCAVRGASPTRCLAPGERADDPGIVATTRVCVAMAMMTMLMVSQ